MLNSEGAKLGISLKSAEEFGTQLGVTSSKAEASMDNVEQRKRKVWKQVEVI